MKNNISFLKDWHKALQANRMADQEGLKKVLQDQLYLRDNDFIHSLCRKIDVNKKLYAAYDDKFQKATSEMLLDNEGWETVFLLLGQYISVLSVESEKDRAIGFKCINTLLKAKDLMPQNLSNHPYIQSIYTELFSEWL
jgi:hypothetical protein